MYLGIDIGGTKTLVASFTDDGQLAEKVKFPTPTEYSQFVTDLEDNVAKLTINSVLVVAVAVPGLLNRDKGVVYDLGNLSWHNKPIRDDIARICEDVPVVIENDARLAGLAEAVLLDTVDQNVLYLTISTGIGGALLRSGRIVKELEDTEMGKMPLMFEGKITHWEDFASGRAIVERYGKRASEINDPKTWQEIGQHIAYGLGILCSVLQPEVVVFGGGAGKYADKFKQTLAEYLEKELHPVVKRPGTLMIAQHHGSGSIYGCYELAKALHGSNTS